jgi:hypothetical protein
MEEKSTYEVLLGSKNGMVTITQVSLLFQSQHSSAQIGHHQVIREEYLNDDGIYIYKIQYWYKFNS